jgi:hypothetical protein
MARGPKKEWPTESPECLDGDHNACAHRWASKYSPWTRPNNQLVLCRCTCHSRCAFAAARTVPSQTWMIGAPVLGLQKRKNDRSDTTQGTSIRGSRPSPQPGELGYPATYEPIGRKNSS